MAEIKEKSNIDIEIISAIFIIIFPSAFILANFLGGFFLPIYVLAMGVGFIIALFFPRSGLFAIIFTTIIFERFFTLSTIFIGKAEYKIYPIDIILGAIFLSILIQFTFRKIKFPKINRSDFFLACFIFLNFIYFFFSAYLIKSDSSLAFSTLKNYAFYPLIFFAVVILIQRKKDLVNLFKFFLAGVIFIISFIIFGILNGNGLWTEFTPLSTEGVRILAFTHGLYLSLALISALVYLIFENKNKTSIYWLSAIWIVGVVGTMMRHLWIAIFLAILSIYFFLPKQKRMEAGKLFFHYISIVLIVAIFVFYAMSMVPGSKIYSQMENTISAVAQRGASIGSAKTDESFAWRKLVWNASYKEFKKNPIMGIGTGKKVYAEEENYRDYIEVRNIHNSYLAVLIQLGFLGLGLFLAFLYANLKSLVKSFKNQENLFFKFSVFGVISIFLVSLCFQPYLETNLLSIFFWMSLGLSRKISANL